MAPEPSPAQHPVDVQRALFETLVREHGPRLRLYLQAALRDPWQREEVFQETLLVAWRRLSDFDPQRPFGHWLRGIASRLVLAQRRSDGRRAAHLEPAALEHLEELCAAEPEREGAGLQDELEALRACVAQLPAPLRQAVELRYREDCRGPQLAQRLDKSLEATKKLLQRVRSRLFECLELRLLRGGARP
jgi:RNA polymerase sigma-70 factor